MKMLFKFIGGRTDMWATRENTLGAMPIMQPNKHVLSFVSVDQSVNVDITVDERHALARVIAEQMQNELFEFDFGQSQTPEPEPKKLNGKIKSIR